MPPDRHYIEDSLAALEDNLSFLLDLAQRPKQEFTSNREASYSAAYALMVCIEAVSGVAAHLLATTSRATPKGMSNTFQLLYEEKILSSPDLVQQLSEMARFRNLIVHRYWKVDYGLVYEILHNHLGDFRAFAEEILRFIEENDL